MPDAYERWLVPTLFQPFAEDLTRRAVRRAPSRILELAAGTGVLTRQLTAALPGAAVTATDLNDAMVELGSARAPGATWRQADATALPFEDGSFDLVVCQFGVMFFPDKPTAYAEARRVLAAGGAFVFNTWGRVDEHAFADALVDATAALFPDGAPLFLTSIPHGYSEVAAVEADLRAGGLTCAAPETITLEGHAETADDVARGFCLGTPLRGEIEARGDLDELTAAVGAAMTARLGRGAVTGRMTAHVFEAVLS